LSKKYQKYDFEFSDNILGKNVEDGLTSALGEKDAAYRFFCEIKVPVTYSRMAALRKAGFKFMQPGIESLDTSILKLMNKGTSATQNIEALRLAGAFGIRMYWGILYDFPEETVDAYERMLSLIPHLWHLHPPTYCNPIRIDRFSPYFKEAIKGSKRFSNARPSNLYQQTFPNNWDLKRWAYFFLADYHRTVPAHVHNELEIAVQVWQEKWNNGQGASLEFKKGFSHGHVIDSRKCFGSDGNGGLYFFSPSLASCHPLLSHNIL
jgi:hypothetical protein